MLRLFCLLVFFIFSFSQESYSNVIDNFFKVYETKGTENAINAYFSTNPFFYTQKEILDQLKETLVNYTSQLGKYYSYEHVKTESIGKSYVIVEYMVKYERQPFKFYLYRGKTDWKAQKLELLDIYEQ